MFGRFCGICQLLFEQNLTYHESENSWCKLSFLGFSCLVEAEGEYLEFWRWFSLKIESNLTAKLFPVACRGVFSLYFRLELNSMDFVTNAKRKHLSYLKTYFVPFVSRKILYEKYQWFITWLYSDYSSQGTYIWSKKTCYSLSCHLIQTILDGR